MKRIYLSLITIISLMGSAYADRLVIKGSDTLGAKLVPQLAEQFKAQHPGTTFDIAAEGSTTGIAAIIDGTAEIGMSSRRAKTSEVGAAAVKGLTKKQVEQIFTGDVTDWSAVGGSGGKISIYTRNTSSGTYSDFKELAMKKRDYAGGSQKMAGNEQIAAEVGKNPNGVGYVGMAYTKAGGVKALPIDGILPSVKSVQAHTYPYWRPTFYYTNGDPSGLAKDFVDFTVGPGGQRIVAQVGFVPIK